MTKRIRKIVLFTIVTTLLTVTGCGDKKTLILQQAINQPLPT